MPRGRGPINPYLAGPPITQDHGFYGRNDIIETVVNTLTTTRQNAVVLHGQRRIGKTSLLYRIKRDTILHQQHIPIFFDLQAREGYSLGRILHSLGREIVEEMDLDIPVPAAKALSTNSAKFARSFLPKVYEALNGKRLLLLFDEFDVVVPVQSKAEEDSDTFSSYLRSLIAEETEHLVFVFVVGQRLDLLGEGYQRLFKGAQTLPISRLTQQDSNQLLTELGKGAGISYTPEALNEVWDLTNGHPYITQLIGSEVFISLQRQKRDEVVPDDIGQHLDKAMQSGQGALEWFWNGFDTEQQWVLAAVADLTDRHNSVRGEEIDRTLKDHLLFVTPLALDKAYRDLLQGDFLIQAGDRHYSFAVEFIRYWIVKQHPLEEIKRRIEEISPDALNYYQLGLHAFGRGEISKAIDNYRLSLENNPHFARARLDLGRALRARVELDAAIAEFEEAFKLGADEAREELVEIRTVLARQSQEIDHQEVIAQTQRILEIDPDNPDGRQMFSKIYLSRAKDSLSLNKHTEAIEALEHLLKPVPLLKDEKVADEARQLFLDYSQRLCEQTSPPNWNEAQQTLRDLELLDLATPAIWEQYNRITLDKATTLLENKQVEQGLSILKNELHAPLPEQAIKMLLLNHSDQQIELKYWTRAVQTLETLAELIPDTEGGQALQTLYHTWGDYLADNRKFSEAISVYHKGVNEKTFKEKIVKMHLAQGDWSLKQHNFTEAETNYLQALGRSTKKAIKQHIQEKIENYIDTCLVNKRQEQAKEGIKILKNLKFAESVSDVWQTKLQLDQAQVELEQEEFDQAFQRLNTMDASVTDDIKSLIKNYAQRKARQVRWRAGDEALRRLNELLPTDHETLWWHTNWRYIWAENFSTGDIKERFEAKTLCQKILDIAPEHTPLIGLLTSFDLPEDKEPRDLRHETCGLLGQMLLSEAQNNLVQDNLTGAETYFKEALALPFPSDHLRDEIRNKLRTFSESQRLRENAELARHALEIANELLGLDDHTLLMWLDIQEAQRMFKEDKLQEAFNSLQRLKDERGEDDLHEAETLFYQFSRLYAGRDDWDKSLQVLEGLRKWLGADYKEQVDHLRNTLNKERLETIRYKNAAPAAASTVAKEIDLEIEYLEREIEAIWQGYDEAKALGLPVTDLEFWIGHLTQTSQTLAQAHLDCHDVNQAIQVYQKLLSLQMPQTDLTPPMRKMYQSLYAYSERMLHLKQWNRGEEALNLLKRLDLPPIYGQTQPDPRIDGAIQRIILSHVKHLLNKHHIQQAFVEINHSPRPHAEGEIKSMVFIYVEDCTEEKLDQAIVALDELNKFLLVNRENVYDQEVLRRLIDLLRKRGQLAEDESDLTTAARFYGRALSFARKTDPPCNIELAEDFIRVILHYCQARLANDPLDAASLEEAIQRYKKILKLPEHTAIHNQHINDALVQHAFALAEMGRWVQAYHILDQLDDIYDPVAAEDKTVFATKRRELILHQADIYLEAHQLDPIFKQLRDFEQWLDAYQAPDMAWADNVQIIKDKVYEFHQGWLEQGQWANAIELVEQLASLLVNDTELIAWKITALQQWGLALQEEGVLDEASEKFEQALEQAKRHDISIPETEEHFLEIQLALAEKQLELDNIDEALAFYKRILEQEADSLDRGEKIRQTLKRCTDQRIQKNPPDWEVAKQILNIIQHLELENEETVAWQQKLRLQEVEAHLRQDNFDMAFAILETQLELPHPLSDIKSLIKDYQKKTPPDNWPSVIEVYQRLGRSLGEDEDTKRWVARELTALGRSLKAEDLAAADRALSAAIEFSES